MKKLSYFTAGFLCAVIIMISVPVAAQQQVSVLHGAISVLVNGVNIGSDTLLFNDRTYVPLRYISESFGADVDYDPFTRTAIITTLNQTTTHFEYFPNVPTFEAITGVSNISIFEHDTNRLRFSVSKSYSSDYEFLQYLAALTAAGFMDEFGQDIGGNGTIVLTGEDAQIVVSMLGQWYTFSVART